MRCQRSLCYSVSIGHGSREEICVICNKNKKIRNRKIKSCLNILYPYQNRVYPIIIDYPFLRSAFHYFHGKRQDSDCDFFQINGKEKYDKVRLGCEREIWTQNRTHIDELWKMLEDLRNTAAEDIKDVSEALKPSPMYRKLWVEVNLRMPTLLGEETDADLIVLRLTKLTSAFLNWTTFKLFQMQGAMNMNLFE